LIRVIQGNWPMRGNGEDENQVSGSSPSRMSPELAERFEREALPYRPQLVRTALQLTQHRQDAEDLVQEAIARACAAFHRFTPGTNLKAWLHRILLNTFINGYRKRQREPILTVLELDHVQPCDRVSDGRARSISAEETVLSRVPAPDLVAALAELPVEFRQVLYLIDVEGFSYREAADIMNSPLGTVMSRLHRARTSVRARLTSEHENGVFESHPRGEPRGTRSQEVPHVQRDSGGNHRGGGNRHRGDCCLRDDRPPPTAAAALRP
jgi:RNA polymerase sigma-70 factor, ECF subfamily